MDLKETGVVSKKRKRNDGAACDQIDAPVGAACEVKIKIPPAKDSTCCPSGSSSTSTDVSTPPTNEWKTHLKTLIQIFPDADLAFLEKTAKELRGDVNMLHRFISNALENKNYPMKEEEDHEGEEEDDDDDDACEKALWAEQLETFISILPDADPSFLEEKARELYEDRERCALFLNDAIENKNFPTRKDWQWRQDQMALQKKYKEEFSVQHFLDIFPNPFAYFSDKDRKCPRVDLGKMYLRNKYTRLRVNDLNKVFSKKGFNLTLTCSALDNWKGTCLKAIRPPNKEYDIIKEDGSKEVDLPFLQEVAFIENQQSLRDHLDNVRERRDRAFQEAKDGGHLVECMCCFDNEVLLEESSPCSDGHIFCNDCVRNSSEVAIGDGKTSFPCLSECDKEFEINVLQKVLKPVIFSKLMQRKQIEEVKAAGLEDLVQCPFCNFCNIQPPEFNVFRCLNPECMRESCRLCKKDSHVPKRCDEDEDNETKMRTYIENKMTEALVRTCWKCEANFVKESGCNKMTCQCGALMCYVCRKPVKDYSHFNGRGGDAFEKCPLYSDFADIHDRLVNEAANLAKSEVLDKYGVKRLKNDPTANLKVRSKQRTAERQQQRDNALQPQMMERRPAPQLVPLVELDNVPLVELDNVPLVELDYDGLRAAARERERAAARERERAAAREREREVERERAAAREREREVERELAAAREREVEQERAVRSERQRRWNASARERERWGVHARWREAQRAAAQYVDQWRADARPWMRGRQWRWDAADRPNNAAPWLLQVGGPGCHFAPPSQFVPRGRGRVERPTWQMCNTSWSNYINHRQQF